MDDETTYGIGKLKMDKETGTVVTEVEIDRNAALAGIVAMMGWKKPAQVDLQVSGIVTIEAVRAALERAFMPIRDVPAPPVIPIEEVSHILIDVQPPPVLDVPDLPERPVQRLAKFDLNVARAALESGSEDEEK